MLKKYYWIRNLKKPERTTRSFTVRLLLAKDCLRVVKLENGEGMLAKASESSETFPSRLPVSTSHMDLLNCSYKIHKGMKENSKLKI